MTTSLDYGLPDLRTMHFGRIAVDLDPSRGMWRLVIPGLNDVFCRDEKDAIGVAQLLSAMSHSALMHAREMR